MGKNLTNEKFGHLKVLSLDTSKSEKMLAKSYWLCQCDCENQTIKSVFALLPAFLALGKHWSGWTS